MSHQVFEIIYSSQNGPTSIKNLTFKTHSPKGYIRLTVQGPAQQLPQQLQQIRQQLKQSDSDTRRCDNMYVKELFEAFQAMGCSFQGTQDDKQTFLKEYQLETDVKDLTKILHDDCGGAITLIAYFRDQTNYYRIETFMEWPGYEP